MNRWTPEGLVAAHLDRGRLSGLDYKGGALLRPDADQPATNEFGGIAARAGFDGMAGGGSSGGPVAPFFLFCGGIDLFRRTKHIKQHGGACPPGEISRERA